MHTWTPPTRRRVRAVRDRLRAVYGVPRMAPHGDPLAEVVLTVLSQSTNDRNRDVAYLRLRARLPTWEEVRDAPREVVEEAIRPGGISKVKSGRIQRILEAISEGPPAPVSAIPPRSPHRLARAPPRRARAPLRRAPATPLPRLAAVGASSRSTGWRRPRWTRRATT